MDRDNLEVNTNSTSQNVFSNEENKKRLALELERISNNIVFLGRGR